MAPLPDNGTPRLFLDYTSLGVEHTLLLRPAVELTVSEQGAMANAWAAVLGAKMLNTDSIYAVRYSPQGANFSLNLLYTPVPGALPANTTIWDQDPESVFLSWTARSTTTGRRGRYTLFTPVRSTTWPLDNRYSPGEDAVIDALRTNVTNLVGFGTTGVAPLTAIDGTFQSVYAYTNIGLNAYWQREQRT